MQPWGAGFRLEEDLESGRRDMADLDREYVEFVGAASASLRRTAVTVAAVPDSAYRHDFAAGHADRDEVLEALRSLGPRQRACVVLRYYEDLTIEETAEILGCSEGTVKSQASRGLDTLRQAIDRARRTSRAL
jgi:RNA polymerase sigma factor (sigma-70 family)